MQVSVDWDRCEGHGMCEERAGRLFALDDDGNLAYTYDGRELPADQEADAVAAVGVCPVAALTLLR
ncbi:ferredoxin [Nocardia cyriacigeorgica]|uniref:ferredoxin n=1 Tax=Nocardia cyriacigeorgica TaxID=135487 RepID=UPI0024538B4D|nr:ferredoxin [Nocardia cyriacigeorgica]